MDNAAPVSRVINTVRAFTDTVTGREIRQLTRFESGAHLGYFRNFRKLPDGRLLGRARHESGSHIVIDAESGDIELLAQKFWVLRLREQDGRAWFLHAEGDPAKKRELRSGRKRELWQIDLPHGEPEFVCGIPDELPGEIEDITIDGRHVISCEYHQDLGEYPIPTTKDVWSINRYLSRPRRGAIWACDLQSGTIRKLHETHGVAPSHMDASPADPALLRFCHDMPDALGQRIWTMHVDGSNLKPIRLQAFGEMITHEFWWTDPALIGFTYQDRRQDPTLTTHPWAEYALADTRFGLADLAGNQVYLSDPLDSYHSHIYRSPDGQFISGEGTERNSFVCAARFSRDNPRLQMTRLAAIHTRYVPFRGQGVDCNFSGDSRWLIYADKLDGPDKPHQLFAVRVEL